jgi:uncharacterized RDD family membrane protein YckC
MPPPPPTTYAAPPPTAAYGAAPPGGLKYAGFWIRVVGLIIDNIIVNAVSFGLIRGLGVIKATCLVTDVNSDCIAGTTTVTEVSPLLYVILLIPILYYIIGWGLGGTIGQRVLGMRVADAETGKPIGVLRGLLRFIGYIISVAVIFIGLIWVAFDPRKQGWHDKFANSVVVRRG